MITLHCTRDPFAMLTPRKSVTHCPRVPTMVECSRLSAGRLALFLSDARWHHSARAWSTTASEEEEGERGEKSGGEVQSKSTTSVVVVVVYCVTQAGPH